MNSRERILAVLDGKPVDRVPIWLLFPYHRTRYYVDVHTNPCYKHIFEESKKYAVMLDRRNLAVRLWGPEVEDKSEKVEENGWIIDRRTLTYKGERLVSEYRHRGSEIEIKKLLENEADLELYCSFPIPADSKAIKAEMDKHYDKYMQERKEFPQEYGAMMLDLGEPISQIYNHANLTEYPIWSLSHMDMIERTLQRLQEHFKKVYQYCLDRKMAEVYFLVGSELASPPMVSRPTFQRWIVPFAKELIQMIHAGGSKAIQHYHGQIGLILEDFVTMGADGLHTIEAPPIGNCTLSQAYDVIKDKITLIGNIQYDCFRSYTEQEMREEVRRVLEEVNGRRFILSPSAGPYEEVISEQMQKNYLAFMKAGWEFGAK